MQSLKILLVSPEAVPYAKTGGLADVAGALPKALKAAGHDVILALPLYSAIDRQKYGMELVCSGLNAEIDGRTEIFNLYQTISAQGFKVWFIEHPKYFDRPELYRDPSTGEDWADNDERFALFSRAILESCRETGFIPDVIHCNDWQSGLIPALMKVDAKYGFLTGVGALFSIHNIAYQGNFPTASFDKLALDWSLFAPGQGFEFWGKLSYLKAGIWYTDIINTVSRRYAQEIQSSNEYGYGFEGILNARTEDLYGVLNGIDYDVWSPEVDELIPAKYSLKNLAGKARCKTALRKRMKLPLVRKDVPIVGVISRLADQKGFDLIAQIADRILALDLQLVILGTGDQKYHEFFTALYEKNPKKIGLLLGFDNQLAHLIEAGSDMFLMPSRYEPCGLNQMYSLKYGTVPVVRETGGLADTIQNVNPTKGTGNGFVFRNYDANELLQTIKFALEVYKDKKIWEQIMVRGMKQDFSWDASAAQYIGLYRKAIARQAAVKV